MPITVVTGLPGHGKTLFTIARWKDIGEKEGRPIFYNGIKDLSLSWQEWDVEKWQDLPPKSIFIVDEAQFRLKVHGRGQLPDWIEKLSVHRHGGLDLVFITQHPMMLDPFVRRLTDRHFHVSRKFGMQRAVVHEFPTGINDNVSKVRTGSIRHDWKYPKEAYSWYKSAEVHTVSRRIPLKIWLGIVAALVALSLIGVAAYRMRPEYVMRGGATSSPVTKIPGQAGQAQSFGTGPAPGVGGQPMTPAEYTAAYTPRLAGLPHTAPIYDGVTAPQQAPYPAACIASAKRCQCYSQQGTRLDMDDHLCRNLADGGFFVAWNASGERVHNPPQPADRPQDGAPPLTRQVAGSFGPSAPQFVAQAVDEDAGSLPRRVRRVAQ